MPAGDFGSRATGRPKLTPSPMPTADMMMPTVGLYVYPSHGRAPLAVGFIPKIHDPLEAKIVS
jgi:hypothetical protein